MLISELPTTYLIQAERRESGFKWSLYLVGSYDEPIKTAETRFNLNRLCQGWNQKGICRWLKYFKCIYKKGCEKQSSSAKKHWRSILRHTVKDGRSDVSCVWQFGSRCKTCLISVNGGKYLASWRSFRCSHVTNQTTILWKVYFCEFCSFYAHNGACFLKHLKFWIRLSFYAIEVKWLFAAFETVLWLWFMMTLLTLGLKPGVFFSCLSPGRLSISTYRCAFCVFFLSSLKFSMSCMNAKIISFTLVLQVWRLWVVCPSWEEATPQQLLLRRWLCWLPSSPRSTSPVSHLRIDRHLAVIPDSYFNLQPIKSQLRLKIEAVCIDSTTIITFCSCCVIPTCYYRCRWLCLGPHTFFPTINISLYNDKMFLESL